MISRNDLILSVSVATAVWDKAEAMSFDHLAGTVWAKPFRAFIETMIKGGRKGLAPEEVGEIITTALTTRNPKTRYDALKGKFLNVTLPSLLPDRMVDRLVGRQLGLLPGTRAV